jgi:hypothetical protein
MLCCYISIRCKERFRALDIPLCVSGTCLMLAELFCRNMLQCTIKDYVVVFGRIINSWLR